jgi:membrane protein insertase Oxa1/YidC/SpoIIIJ
MNFKKLSIFTLTLLSGLSFASKNVSAQISADTLNVGTSIGTITSLQGAFYWVANFMKYIGWAGVVIGVVIVIALLIYKLIGSDDTETMKKVQGGITKAVVIVILGVILVGAGFIVNTVAGLFGSDATFGIDDVEGGT